MYFSVPLKKEWTNLCSKHLQRQSITWEVCTRSPENELL